MLFNIDMRTHKGDKMENVEGQNTEVNAEAEQPEVTTEQFNQLQEQVKTLASTNDRLLSQSKDWADKYRGLRDTVDSKEKAELEASENWQELLEKEKNERHETNEKYKNLKKSALKNSLNFEVAKYANDAHDVDTLISAVIDSGLIEVSEDETSFKGVKDAVENLRNDKVFLFKKEAPATMVNSAPHQEKPRQKSMAEFSDAEKAQALRDSIKLIHK